MEIEQRALDRILREFPAGEQTGITDLLASYAGPEKDRVRWDILLLSEGDLKRVETFVQEAQQDYRNILYWAEYYETDPYLKNRDPKKMVKEIIEKWGKKGVQRENVQKKIS